MKSVLILGLLLSINAFADSSKDVIISDQTHTLEVALNESSVLCLKGDYMAPSFKVAIPDIAAITYLDHTSPGAPGPCINAGYCQVNGKTDFMATTDDRMPIFHDVTKPSELVQVRVIRKETYTLIEKNCVHAYVELVSATIRGTDFKHTAYLPLASLNEKACQSL